MKLTIHNNLKQPAQVQHCERKAGLASLICSPFCTAPMRAFALFLFCTCSILAAAQAPSGYMGKRLTVGYELNTFGAWIRPNANDSIGISSFNTKKQFYIDWVTDRRTAFGVTYKHYRTTAHFTERDVEYIGSNSSGGSFSCFLRPQNNAPMFVNHYGLYGKFFYGSEIAPLGSYLLIGLERIRWRVAPNPTTFDHDPDPFQQGNCFDSNPVMNHEPRMHATMLNMAIGKQRVLFDHVVLSYGLQMGWVFGAIGEIDPFATTILEERYNEENYIKTVTRSRLFNHNFFNVQLGIGWLAY